MKKHRGNAGFTLVEIIVTLTVLVVVAAFSVPSLSGFIEDANAKDCKAKMTDLSKAYTNQLVENRVTTPGSTVDEGVMKDILIAKGATQSDTANMTYTGLCPDGGTYTIKTQPATTDPNLTTMILSCDKHGDQEVVTGATAKVVTSIAVTKQPSQTAYTIGDTFSAAGGQITITYNDRTTKTVDMTTDMCSNPNMGTTGTKPVTVTYGGKTANFNITVTDKATLTNLTASPTTISYYKTQPFAKTDFTFTAFYSNESSKPVSSTDSALIYTCEGSTEVTNFTKTSGSKTVNVAYTENGTTVKTSITLTVNEPKVTKIEVKTSPTTTTYDYNTDYDLSGGTLKVTWDYGEPTTVDMTDVNVSISGYSSTTPGSQTLTLTYGGQTTQLQVTVVDSQTGITVAPPTKTTYIKGEELNLDGGIAQRVYLSGRTDDTFALDTSNTTGYDKVRIGTQTLTVTDPKNSRFTATFTIEVLDEQTTIFKQMTAMLTEEKYGTNEYYWNIYDYYHGLLNFYHRFGLYPLDSSNSNSNYVYYEGSQQYIAKAINSTYTYQYIDTNYTWLIIPNAGDYGYNADLYGYTIILCANGRTSLRNNKEYPVVTYNTKTQVTGTGTIKASKNGRYKYLDYTTFVSN